MRIGSFMADGSARYGVFVERGVVDMTPRFGSKFPSLRTALAAGALAELRQAAAQADVSHGFDAITMLPPIPDPDKVVCIGLNYRAHAAEGGFAIPTFPSVFVRLTNTLVGHGGAILRPKVSSDLDFEGELAVVIGRGGRHIPKETALAHVAGYSCFNDASVRDYQFKHSLAVGKNFPNTGGFGPWIVTGDEIPDPSRLTLRTRLNGEEVQNGPTSDLIFSVPDIIAYVSAFTELVPGDVISTGTPHGVGFARKPPLWMKPGDTVEIEISAIGVLRNSVAAEAA